MKGGNQIGFEHLEVTEPCLRCRRKPEMQTVAIAVCRRDLAPPRDFGSLRLDGTIEPEFRTVPGFSNQWDREIEHRRHLTPPTID